MTIIPPTYTPRRPRTPRPIVYGSCRVTLVDSIIQASIKVI